MLATLARLCPTVGAVYGLSVVAVAEATHTSEVAALPLRRRVHVYLVALALGSLIWPVALLRDRDARP
ncbi:MAG: hypothetical protein V3T24_10335 [Longimicrobiales bacterium]